jgi:hypothetical protein
MANTPTIGRASVFQANLLISGGADNTFIFNWAPGGSPIDLSAWTGRSQVRSKVGGTVWFEPDVTTDVDGNVTVTVTSEMTTGSAWTSGTRLNGVWDVELVDTNGVVTRLVQGTVILSPDVTQL